LPTPKKKKKKTAREQGKGLTKEVKAITKELTANKKKKS